MQFRIENTPADLSNTPIENLFLDIYMPMAPGNYVKVYLLGYRYALESNGSKRFSSQTVADNLNLSIDEVAEAWSYWEEKQLVRCQKINNDAGESTTVEFVSLKYLHLKHTAQVTMEVPQKATSLPAYAATPADLLEVRQAGGFRQFFDQIDQLMQRPLVPNEEMQILEWLHHLKVEKAVILMAFEYATRQKNVRSIPYVAGIIRNWADEGLTDAPSVQSFIERSQLRYRQYDQIFKSLGFYGRLPTEAEAALMDQWFDDYSFSMDMILKACGNSANTSKPSIKYIHGILERWHQKKMTTPDAVDLHEKQRQDKKAEPVSGLPGKKAPKKTGFHLSESRGKDYTNEQLEKILLGRKRRPRKEDA